MSWRTFIVGLGQIGLQYDLELDPSAHVYSHARAFSSHPAFELVGGADAEYECRQLFERHYGVAASGDLAALASLQPEVVAIAVPTPAHAAVLEQVLAHCRPRAILCEKPLSYDAAVSDAMVRACETAGVALYVNYIRRADPAVTAVRERLQDGRIAGPVKGVAWYSKGVFNNGLHFIDLLQYWLGPLVGHLLLQSGRRRGDDVDADFLLRFAGGEVMFLAACEEDFSHYTVELVARNGRLRYDLGGEQVWWQPAMVSSTAQGYVVLDPALQAVPGDLGRIQLHVSTQLDHALRGETCSLCTGREALTLIDAIQSICVIS